MAANGAVPTASPTRTAAAAAAAPPATGAAAVLPAKKKSRQPLRILCFGDSLTAGTTSWGSHYHPYGPRMGEVLSERLGPSGFDVMPTVDGRPGDMTVTPPGLMVERMQADFSTEERPYEWVVILAGTNDLGWGFTPAPIIESLKKIWDIPLSRGTKVLALTIMECANCTELRDLYRFQVNRFIRNYRRENFYFYDLCKAIPWNSMAEADRKKYWDDGLHLTPAGYDMMGERIAESLIDILSVPAAQARIPSQPTIPMRQTRRPRFSRPVVQEDPLDEELGDASDIQRGYVVVRKRDLD